jgi:uroporphyrinogen decarboxylase
MTYPKVKEYHFQRLVSFWKHHPVADQQANALAAETLAFHRKFNCDFIKVTPAGTWQAVCHGVTDTWNSDFLGRRIITKTIINQPDDWLSLPDFSTAPPPLLNEIVGASKLVYEEVKNKIPVVSTVFCPISQAIQIAGLPVFLQHVAQHPAKVLAGINQITQNTLFIINQLIEAGSKGIYFVSQHMRHDAISPEIYKAFGELPDAQCLEACSSLLYSIFHIHGANIYLSLGDIPANCFIHYEYDSEMSIPTPLLQKYSSRLLTGIPSSEMARCHTDEEIQQLIVSKASGNIISCGCVLPLDFPDESIIKWIDISKNISEKCN